MEILFQNKRQDIDAFCEYMVNETEQGKRIRKQLFRNWLIWTILVSLLFGFFTWALYENFLFGVGALLLALFFAGSMKLLLTGFQPIFIPALELYKKQEKSLTPKDYEIFELARTITVDEKWLEIRSSEAVHRWRWRRVNHIELTSKFVFIHVGACPVVYVPKRDFPTEQSFIEFGKTLVELKEKNKDQVIGEE